jgi:hypothetical protein
MNTVITHDGTFIIVDPKTGKSASGRTREEAKENLRRAA